MCFIGEEACFFKKTAKDKEKSSFEKATDSAVIITLVEFLLVFGAAFCGAAVCALEEESNRFRICLTGEVVGMAVGAIIGIIDYDGFKDTTLQTLYPKEMEKNRHAPTNRILALQPLFLLTLLFLEFLFVSGFLLPEKGCF